MTESVSACPNCGSRTLYVREKVGASGSYGPNFLPGLGPLRGILPANLTLVLCGECGLLRLFAGEAALVRLHERGNWREVLAPRP